MLGLPFPPVRQPGGVPDRPEHVLGAAAGVEPFAGRFEEGRDPAGGGGDPVADQVQGSGDRRAPPAA